MKTLRLLAAAILSAALLVVSASVALAWPDQPPDKATISGPGIDGDAQITDRETLTALKLGALEDFSRGTIARPQISGDGYKITRYFDGGSFNFASLTYYPDPAGGRGYLYFEDGPDLQGNHTPYNGQWLYATAAGDAAMQHLLQNLGAGAATHASSASAGNPATAPVVAEGVLWRAAALAALAVVAIVAAGRLIVRRRRAA